MKTGLFVFQLIVYTTEAFNLIFGKYFYFSFYVLTVLINIREYSFQLFKRCMREAILKKGSSQIIRLPYRLWGSFNVPVMNELMT
jgi:hypothetical protein